MNPEPPVTTTRWPVKSSSAGSTASASTPLTIAPTYTVAVAVAVTSWSALRRSVAHALADGPAGDALVPAPLPRMDGQTEAGGDHEHADHAGPRHRRNGGEDDHEAEHKKERAQPPALETELGPHASHLRDLSESSLDRAPVPGERTGQVGIPASTIAWMAASC